MKKIICLLLTAVILASTCTVAFAEIYVDVTLNYSNGNVIYLLTTNGLVCREEGDALLVTGYNLNPPNGVSYNNITIPAKFNGKPIILGEGSLAGIPVKKVIFEYGIHSLPKNLCRGSDKITEVVIPMSVREIGDFAFKECPNLAFGGTIYAETIGTEAFGGCTELSITVQNARSIGERAFEGCKSVSGVGLYEDTEVVFNSGEATVKGITYALREDGVKIIKCDKSLQGELVIPDEVAGYKVVEIGAKSFYDCGYITRVVMPETIKKIGAQAFLNCYGIGEVVLNNSLEEIGEEAFANCKRLTAITIPDSVGAIKASAFKGSGIESIEIGNGVTRIGEGAFSDCNSLTSIVIPDNVKILGADPSVYQNGYFGGIGTDKKLSPFYGCGKLKTVTIGKSVENLYADMFYYCDSLEEVNISTDNPLYTSVDGVVYTKDMKKLLYYPGGKVEDVFVVPMGVCEIGEGAITTKDIGVLYIPESLTNIHGDNVISETITYTNIEEIPEETEIKRESGVYNTISWRMERGVLTLTGQGALKSVVDGKYTPIPWDAKEVTGVIIGEGISEIHGVFKNHVNMTTLTLPQSLQGIYDLSFYNCKSLENVIIPAGVNHIGPMAFGECYSLKDVKLLSAGEVKICHGAFDIADGAMVYFPDGVKWIDKNAFTHIYSTGTNNFGAKNNPQDVTLVANTGSYIEKWAGENGVKFKAPPTVLVGESYLTGSNVYEESGVLYISGKLAFEALGVKVECDNQRNIAVCTVDSRWMILTEGEKIVATNEGNVEVDHPAKWINGVFMVPDKVLVDLGFTDIKVSQAGISQLIEKSEMGGVIPVSLNNITVSQVPEAENGPYNMIDGLTSTRWAAEVTDKNEPCWAVFDLGEVCELDKIGLSFYRDSIRTTEFSVEVSVDGVTYTKAIERRNSMGRSEEVEYYSLDNIYARYVKLSGYGNSSTYSNIMNWFSPTQVEIYKAGMVVVPQEPKTENAVLQGGKINLKNVKVTASIISEPQNSTDKLYDESFSTYCVLYVQNENDPQFIQFDLGKVYDVEKLALAFRWADKRTTYFDIRVSEDGTNYKTVLPRSASDKNAMTFEYFGIYEKARYVRVYGYSNTYNRNWVSITEAEIYVKE